MRTVSANEAKQSFGRMLTMAQREPVIIEKHHQPTAVLLSIEEYDRLKAARSENNYSSREPDVSLVRESSVRRQVAKNLPIIPVDFEPEPKNLTAQEMNDLVKEAEAQEFYDA